MTGFGLGSLCSPAAWIRSPWPMVGDTTAPAPAASPFGFGLSAFFGRLFITTFNESSLTLAMPSTLAPSRLMLAAASSPRGLDAPASLRDRIRCPRAFNLPRRVRVMGHPVTPGLRPRDNQSSDFVSRVITVRQPHVRRVLNVGLAPIQIVAEARYSRAVLHARLLPGGAE